VLAPYVRGFVRAGLAWLGIGIAIGIGMTWWPADYLAYRPAHAHANLLGFLSMFLFGVAYHVLPRFVGKPLSERQTRWAMRHLWIQNAGLALLVTGWLVRPLRWDAGQLLLIAGAPISAIGAGIFVAIAWRLTGADGRVELRPPDH
jgi:drug/metabolite transporter (DMT)-like permease